MKQFHLCHVLAALSILLTPRAVSAVGRGPPRVSSLRSDAPRSRGTNTVYQGQSPAEMEEEEELGEELDSTQEQGSDQEGSPAASPVQMTQSSMQPSAPLTGPPNLETSLVQNPAEPEVAETAHGDLGSKPSSFQGPPLERQHNQFLSSFPQLQEPDISQSKALSPEEPHMLSNSEASAAAAELAALSSTAPSMIPMVKPEKSLMTSSRSDYQSGPSVVKTFVPAVPPQSLAGLGTASKDSSKAGSFQATDTDTDKPKNDFPAVIKGKTNVCHPPCIQGRGICNDNLCFCKSPFSGTTCQHKMNPFMRVKTPMVVGLCAVAIVFGMLFAQVLHSFITSRIEKRLVWLGEGTVRQEVWMPPDNSKGKKK